MAREVPPQTSRNMHRIVDSEKPLVELKKKPLRPKYVSLTSWKSMRRLEVTRHNLDSLSNTWSTGFAIISENNENVRFCGYRPEHILRLLGLHKDRSSIIKAWMLLQRSNREIYWHGMMLWALQNSPERALKLLDASVTTPRLRPSRHVVEDCIRHLCAFYLEKKESPDPLKVDTLLRLICNFAEATPIIPGRNLPIPQNAVFLILQHCDDHQVGLLFQTLRRQNISIHENTLLQFLKRFIDMGEISLSLEILRNLVSSGIDVTSVKVQSACVKFLRGPIRGEDRYSIQSSILTEMLEIGIRPGVIMYSVIILNAVEAADYQNAWDMYKLGIENNLKPNAVTYSIMLKGAKQSLDTELIEHIIHDAENDGNLPRDKILIGDLLNAVFACELVRNQESVFTALLRSYTRYCSVGPLQDLGMVLENVDTPSGLKYEVRSPSSWTLGLMMVAYIKQHQDSDLLIHSYMRYYKLVEEENPIIAPLAQTDFIFNAFVMALGRNLQSLESCLLVVKHMLQPPEAVKDSKPVKIAVPTVQTWTILAAAYFRHGQKLAAEKVLEMMEARGMKPNDVTWNIIIRGYSKLQEVDNAVGAMKRMEAAGFEGDAYTLKGLGRIWDRNAVLEALRNAIETEPEEEDLANDFEDGSSVVE